MNDLPSDPKAQARTRARETRAKAHRTVDPGQALARLVDEVKRLCPTGGCIAGYAAIRSEIDPAPGLERLNTQGYQICLPVVEGPARPLGFRAWTPGEPLIPGAFGALIPESAEPTTPDLLIVPLLAFDARGFRLGYGGGFYDRTLERLRASRPTKALGFAYAAQQQDQVPTEPTDQPLDGIVTERGLITPT